MRRALLVTLAVVALLLVATPPAALYCAVFTESGLRLVVRLVPRHIGRVRIGIEGVHGTIAHGLTVDRLTVDDARVHLRFTGISARVALAPLLLQTVRVRRLRLRTAFIDVQPMPHRQPYRPRRWHFLPHWLAVRADDLRIDSGTLILPNGRRYDASRLSAAGLVRPSTARLDRIALTLGALDAQGKGRLHAGTPLGLVAMAHVAIRPAHQPAWIIEATGKGDLDDLAVHAQFTAPLRADLSGHGLDLLHGWRWEGRARIEDFNLHPWGGGRALGDVTGDLAVTADPAGITARGPVTIPTLRAGALEADFTGGYANRVVTVRSLELTHPSGARLTAQGQIGIVAHGPRLALQGDWTRFRWPLAARSPVVTSAGGHYVLRGLKPYAVQGDGELAVRGLQPIEFTALDGTLGTKALRVRRSTLAAFGGHAEVGGDIDWSMHTWSASGTASDVSPVSLRPDLPGRVTFGFEASGARFGRGADFAVTVHQLSGELRRLSARADGTISRHGGVWRFTGVRAQLGRTALSLDGTLGARLALNFRLAAGDLALLAPGTTGRLEASGMLSGPRNRPAIDLTASGSALGYRGFKLSSLETRIAFDPRHGTSQAQVRARGLAFGTRRLGDLAFTLAGPPLAQRAALSVSGRGYHARALATGALSGGLWRGELTHVTVRGADTRLALASSTAVTVSRDVIHLDRMCLAGEPARFCASADWTPRTWSVIALASGLPLQLLTAGASSDVQYRGRIGLAAQLSASDRGAAQGRLGVTLTDAELVRRTGDGELETTRLGAGALTLDAATDRITGDFQVGGGAAGSLRGRWTLHRTTAEWLDMPLDGTLTLQAPLSAWAPLYAHDVDGIGGVASANLALAGTLGAPLLDGTISVDGGELDLYEYNLQLRATALRARLHDNGIDFDGTARIGKGAAAARGHLVWRGGQPSGDLELSGSNLRVVDIPEAQIDASPDLRFALDGRELNITGAVKIPQARITPADLTNAVRVSPDQVIVGEPSDSSGGALKVATQIKIELGSQVRIKTQGLTGRLEGSVVVTSGGESITRASGELRIADGKYSAYGRQLDIDRGRLIYTASPLDNPGIDVRAVKRFHDPNVGATVAGINVRGTLRQPQMTFFSEPPLAQQQIMSLVFAGGTLFGGPQLGASAAANNSRSENAQLIGQGAAVLGSQIGLPVGIEPTYNNDTALMLGKYLSPRLYVSYGITLLQSLNIVKLRYTLGDHWALSTEFGQLGGADIVYTFQK